VQRGDALHFVLQLAHVAGPRIAEEQAFGGRGNLRAVVATSLEKVRDQVDEVFAPLGERRHACFHHVDAIEQVLAERGVAHHHGQVGVGGRDEAHVDATHAAFAHASHFPLLQHAQELGLDVGRNLADLVQEQGPATRLLEQPRVRAHRTGEGTAVVAEQLAFQDAGCECCAVDRHEGGVRARAETVQVAREHFLAHPAVSGDEDAHTRIVECQHEVPQALGRGR
jgi:hypothetical protein